MNNLWCILKKPKNSPYWHLRFRYPGESKERSQSLGVREKQVAEKKRVEFIAQFERERYGLVEPKNVIDTITSPIEPILKEFVDDLEARGCSAKYVENSERYVRVIGRENGWKFIRDITSQGFIEWRTRQKKRAASTVKKYQDGLTQFLGWLVRLERLPKNPLVNVDKVKTRGQETYRRRPLTEQETTRLLATAPPERALLYVVAITTGLRRNELTRLEWGDICLEPGDGYIRLQPRTTKNRRGGTIPLTEEVRLMLAPHGVGKRPSDRVLKVPSRLVKFRQDLQAAGIVEDPDRKIVVHLHSLRHTCATWLQAHGFSTDAARRIMRQRTRAMTDHYTHEDQLGLGTAMRQLPPLAPGLPQIVPQNIIQESPVMSDAVPEADSGNSSQSSEVEQDWPIQSSCVHPSPPSETGSCSRIRTYRSGIDDQRFGGAGIQNHESVVCHFASVLVAA